MKIIDAHLHFSSIESFKRTAAELSGVDYSLNGLKAELRAAGVTFAVGMGLTETSLGAFPDMGAPNPMLLDLDSQSPPELYRCVGINPVLLDRGQREEELCRVEAALKKPGTVGIKIYAGYYPYYVYDTVYDPVYKLAASYGLPVVIHSGDTFSERGLLKYSHPLNVDELAVKHRDINFIISHLGDPWVMDAAEVASKNHNVYCDLSGLIVGGSSKIERYKNNRIVCEHFIRALIYTDNYSKYLFGSDWPLAPIAPYIEFVKGLVPEEHHERVFYENAARIFGLDRN